MTRVSGRHQNVLKVLRDLSAKDPHEFLQSVANVIRKTINCETVCILLWDDREKLLITQYPSGLPKKLLGKDRYFTKRKAEKYKFDQGFTGKYIFKQGRTRRALVDFTLKTITDVDTGEPIRDRSIQWDNMLKYKDNSKFGFKSLLCVPLFVRSEKLGVIKLINRLDSRKRLDPRGFKVKDVRALRLFLDSIEHVVETKTHEDRIEAFLKVSKEISNADFNHLGMLSQVADSCAQAMNSTLCVIRLVDGLVIKGPNAEDEVWNQDPNPSFAIKCALDAKSVVKWSTESRVIDTVDGRVLSRESPELAGRGIRSFVIAPVTYQNRSIGTIECYSTLPRKFVSRELEVVETFGSSLVATIFQRQRVAEALKGLSNPFGLFANVDELYRDLIKIIEDYLGTSAVSIWNKSGSADKLELAQASERLQPAYEGKKIKDLPHNSFTARVLSTGKLVELNHQQIDSDRFAYRDFARKLRFRSAALVPLGIRRHAHAVIDVFFRHDRRLFREEKDFLELLAAKAASAIQRIKLIDAFNAIHDAWAMDRGLESTLTEISKRALVVSHADVVMLFYYDGSLKRFNSQPVWDGELFDEATIKKSTVIEDDDLVNHIRLGGTQYFKSRYEYERYLKTKGRQPGNVDFWQRERIHSSAGIQLKHSGDVVGVLWFNYRQREAFKEGAKRLVQAFATMAASEIAYAKLLDEKRAFERIRQDVLMALSSGRVKTEMANGAAKILDSISLAFAEFDQNIETATAWKYKEAQVNKLRGTVAEAIEEFKDISRALETQPGASQSSTEDCSVEEIIERSLSLVTRSFELDRIKLEKLVTGTPRINCYRAQVEHMLMALYLSARTAMENSKNKCLRIEAQTENGYVRIDVSHTGPALTDVSDEQVFYPTTTDGDPCFPICLHIAGIHGGKFVLDRNRTDGWNARILLPVERRKEQYHVRAKHSGSGR